jgi:hypothetical protein
VVELNYVKLRIWPCDIPVWYSTTGSITLKGERATDVKNKLISIAENEKEIASQK